jgi:hypothetical protein
MIVVTSGMGTSTAIISVEYPSGSTCTVTNGTKTRTAKDTSGKALFNVTSGSWTVSCTDGKNEASKKVTAVTNSAVSVTLGYELVLFNNGYIDGYDWSNVSINTSGSVKYLYATISDSTGYVKSTYGFCKTKLDLNDYKKLVIVTGSCNDATIGIVSDTSSTDFQAALSLTSNTTSTLDISSLNSGYLKTKVSGWNSTGVMNISKIYLSM